MKKRLLSLALTLALCLGLTVPAFASGGYEPYTIKGTRYGTPYTITFSAAKAERKTVQMREHYDIGNTYSAYQKKTVTYVTIRPDTKVTALSGDEPMVSVAGVSADGDGRYTQIVMGAPETIENGTGWDAFVTDFPLVYLYSDTGEYLITMDASATPSGFTDVKAGAYYADAVKWAVDRKITSGTSDTTFSPDQTCTVAQILTFLWNANGQPEPTGRNPFSDISSGDYFYKAAVWAAGKGLVSGSKLNPNAPCTRAMVVEYLWKLAGSPKATQNSKNYAPYTITPEAWGGSDNVQLEAAVVEQSTVTLCEDEEVWETGGTVHGKQLTKQVTKVTIRPGSMVAINHTFFLNQEERNAFLGNHYQMDSNGIFHFTDLWNMDGAMSVEHAGRKDTPGYAVLMNDANYFIVVAADNTFTDVPSSAAYAQAVTWAVENGITAGTSDTTFSPSDTCTRGQIVTFLHRAMG